MKTLWQIAATISFILSIAMSFVGMDGTKTFHTGMLCLIVAKLS